MTEIHVGDLLELIENFEEKRTGYQGICLEYSSCPQGWNVEQEHRGVRVSGMEKAGDNGWILAKRFKVVRPAPPTTEGWTL